MTQMVFLLTWVSKRICSWLALSLFCTCCFLLFEPLWGLAPFSALKIWEMIIALVVGLQVTLSSLIEPLIRSHCSTRQQQVSVGALVQACLLALLLLPVALLLGPIWNHVFLVLHEPFAIALVSVTLVMMGFYISGKFF